MNLAIEGQTAVALVVGAGGPTGGPFIWSALAELETLTGWRPEFAHAVVGTSAGAFVAARIPERTEPDAAVLVRLSALSNGDEFRASASTQVAGRLRLFAARVIAMIAPMSRPFAEYNVPRGPFHVGASAVTVQHRTGERHQHLLAGLDDPAAVVRASAAIPGVNQPVELNGVFHVDGAVHSANNVDLVDPEAHPVLVVISPMIPRSGGSIVSRFHRAQLKRELKPWTRRGRTAIVVMPSQEAHAQRRDRELFEPEGARSVVRLL